VEDGENYELTQYSSGFYIPSDKVVRHYDVHDFQEAVEHATTALDVEEAEGLYRRAVDLYKSPFLETIDMKWVNGRRAHLQKLYGQALIGLGRINQERDEFEQALGFFTRALKEIPEREDVHREVIRLYMELDMHSDAREQYERLEQMLKEHYDLEPSRESRELVTAIQ